jgi:hypothetical protein
MKKTIILKKIINFIYFSGLVFVIILPIVGIYILTQIYTDGFRYEDKIYVELSVLFIANVVLEYGVTLLLLYCIYLFKDLLSLFINLSFFNNKVVSLFKKIGEYLFVISVVKLALDLAPIVTSFSYLKVNDIGFSTVKKDVIHIGFKFYYIIYFSIGLFFLVLAEVFKKALELKQENNLTI